MERSQRNRTTLNPGVVDLPKSRRTSAEVARERKKKSDDAAAKAEAKRSAAARVAALERQAATKQNKGSGVITLTSKQPRKRPVTGGTSKDVSFPITNQISHSLKPHAPDTGSFLKLWTHRCPCKNPV